MMCWLHRLTEYQHGGFLCPLGISLGHKAFDGRPKTTRVLLLLQVLAEDDEDGFWDHWGRLKKKTVMLKL